MLKRAKESPTLTMRMCVLVCFICAYACVHAHTPTL